MLGTTYSLFFSLFHHRHFLSVLTAICLGCSWTDSGYCSDQDPPLIMRGKRPVVPKAVPRPGSSYWIKGGDPLADHKANTLAQDATLDTQGTGKVSPTGFLVPRTRGQDSRLTEIYLDRLQIQDPYSSLPIVEDLDIRSLGSLHIHKGIAPYSLVSSHPVATLQLQSPSFFEPSTQIGMQAGTPYGSSFWVLRRDHWQQQATNKTELAKDSDTTFSGPDSGEWVEYSYQIYARQHQTNGRFSYYDDNGTPFLTEDDKTSKVSHNDQRSVQILPIFQVELPGDQTLKVLVRGLSKKAAVRNPGSRTGGRQQLLNQHFIMDYEKRVLENKSSYGLSLSYVDSDSKISDPDQNLFTNTQKSDFQVKTQSAALPLKLGLMETISVFLQPQTSKAMVSARQDFSSFSLERLHHRLHVGTQWKLPLGFRIQTVGQIHQTEDRVRDDSRSAVVDPKSDSEATLRSLQNQGISLGYLQRSIWSWVQWGRFGRLPSLLEEFGNGGEVKSSAGELRSEKIEHLEWGLAYRNGQHNLQTTWSLWQDKVRDKIVFIHTSLNGSKALNLQNTRTRGSEWGFSWQTEQYVVQASWVYQDPLILSGLEEFQIPGVASQRVYLDLSWTPSLYRFSLMNFYSSKRFKDSTNTLAVPGYIKHDLMVSREFRMQEFQKIETWVLVKNLLDVRTMQLEKNDATGETGRTAFSEFSGYPLPGRTYEVGVSATL